MRVHTTSRLEINKLYTVHRDADKKKTIGAAWLLLQQSKRRSNLWEKSNYPL